MTKTVGNVFGKNPDIRTFAKSGEWVIEDCHVGIELELEGFRDVPYGEPYWTTKEDGSLRSYNGTSPYELVSAYPFCGIDLTKSIDVLGELLKKYSPTTSKRCSLHVHLDTIPLRLSQLYNMIILYVVYERVLFKYCDISREENIFCLPFYKASGNIFDHLSKSLVTTDDIVSVTNENDRYNALNLASLRKFGTVEFRHHPATLDIKRIKEWINILMCLRKAGADEGLKFKNIFHNISSGGLEEFNSSVFGEYAPCLFNYDGYRHDVFQGIRNAQEVLYKDLLNKEWSELWTQNKILKSSEINNNPYIKAYNKYHNINTKVPKSSEGLKQVHPLAGIGSMPVANSTVSVTAQHAELQAQFNQLMDAWSNTEHND